MSTSNYITKVAIVGAGGRSGSFMVNELLKTGKHNITALTRSDSRSTLPEGVSVATIDYSNPESLTTALRGQDALIITMSTAAPKEQEEALLKAAGEARVKFVMPNEWGPDTAYEGFIKDVALFQARAKNRKLVEDLGKTAYIGLSTGFWYEWSLGIADSYGFDIKNRRVTFFDEGTVKISTSTWAQVGRAVAKLLSLPIRPAEGGNPQACLDKLKNQLVYTSSFTLSQKDMFDSVLRVTGTKAEEWEITKQSSEERFNAGVERMQEGDRIGFVHMMYTRVFFPDACGDVEDKTLNEMLGLPKEDLDEATKVAVERAMTNPWS